MLLLARLKRPNCQYPCQHDFTRVEGGWFGGIGLLKPWKSSSIPQLALAATKSKRAGLAPTKKPLQKTILMIGVR